MVNIDPVKVKKFGRKFELIAGLITLLTISSPILLVSMTAPLYIYDNEHKLITIAAGIMVMVSLLYILHLIITIGSDFIFKKYYSDYDTKRIDRVMYYMDGYPVYVISLILDGPSNDFTFTIETLSNNRLIQVDVSPLKVNKTHYIPLPRTALILSRSEVASAIGNAIYNNMLPVIDDNKEYDDTVAYISITDKPKKVS